MRHLFPPWILFDAPPDPGPGHRAPLEFNPTRREPPVRTAEPPKSWAARGHGASCFRLNMAFRIPCPEWPPEGVGGSRLLSVSHRVGYRQINDGAPLRPGLIRCGDRLDRKSVV